MKFRAVGIALVVLLALGAAAYAFLLPGLSVARQEPAKLETEIAQWLLRHSVPDSAVKMKNPLGDKPDVAAVRAGQGIFQKKCETCHAYDGGGKTEIGAGTFPRPPSLHMAAASTSDGEIFYHIRNGIRNTAMPAWNMPDAQIWQLVAYIRNMAIVAAPAPHDIAAQQEAAVGGAHYIGSEGCKGCHEEVYARWKKTRMANVVQDPKKNPAAILGDFSKPDPLVTFSKDDIAFTYGSRWKQRYFQKVGDDFFPFPVNWDVVNKKWSKYHVADGTDWWATLYPDPKGDNSARPTGPLCDGCHSVDYNIDTKTPHEWNVGCEACHGAGSAHAGNPKLFNILNPARQDYVKANDTCISCHSQGQPLANPIKGKNYDWAVGYKPGQQLSEFWKLEEHKLGETSFTHFADGTAHKNRMQGNDYVQSLMYDRGVTCFSCHDPHGSDNASMLRKPASETCMSCHGPNTQNGPHVASIQEHTHHAPGSPGSECTACHMPKIQAELANTPNLNVASHTFHFVTPAMTDALKVPNACNACHTDKDTKWAATALASWKDRSPWRMQR